MYPEDRCWNTRAVCALSAGATLVVGQRDEDKAGKSLYAGQYLAVIGPAAALGVGALHGFADRLRSRLSMPVVNLGRGAAGPNDFLDSWPSLGPILTHASAVIIVLMAGRSSANSQFPYTNDGRTAGEKSMARDAGMRRLLNQKDPRVPQLMNESLNTALSEYVTIARKIRERAQHVGREPPRLILLWLSECELEAGGCASISDFPQYYNHAGAAHRVAAAIGAQLVDASPGRGRGRDATAPNNPLPLNQCPACAGVGGRTQSCWMDAARRQMNVHGLAPADVSEGIRGKGHGRVDPSVVGCTRNCHSVIPTYYPADPGHDVATTALLPLLRDLAAAPTRTEEVLYGYPHVMKTGGTSLSIVLAHATKPMCGSKVSEDLTDKALDACEGHTATADGTSYIPNGDNFVPKQLPARANVSSLYGHADAAWILARFPHARMLVLLRRPAPHRLAWFQELKGSAANFMPRGNFSMWIRSSAYASLERSFQIKQHEALLRKRHHSLSGAAAAEALLSNPSVSWVGIADNWLASMLLLEELLGVRLAQFAAQLTIRFKSGPAFSWKDAAQRKPVAIGEDGTVEGRQVQWSTRQPPGGTDWVAEVNQQYVGLKVRLGSGVTFYSPEGSSAMRVSTEDYRELLSLEAKEYQFVDTIERSITRKAADLVRRMHLRIG